MSRDFQVLVTEQDLPKIRAAMAALYRLFIPNNVYPQKTQGTRLVGLHAYTDTDIEEKFDGAALSALVMNGFSAISALEYIFDGNYLGASEIYIAMKGKEVLRVMRKEPLWSVYSLVRRFDPLLSEEKKNQPLIYTSDDIESHPVLLHRKPSSWPTNGVALNRGAYSRADNYKEGVTQQFISLQNNAHHIDECYRQFLSVYLTPDDTFKKTFSVCMEDPLLTFFSNYVLSMKKSFSATLLQTDKFIDWVIQLPHDKLDHFLQECAGRSESVEEMQLLWRQLVLVMTEKIRLRIEKGIKVLSILINACTDELIVTQMKDGSLLLEFCVAAKTFLQENLVFFLVPSSPFLARVSILSAKIQHLLGVIHHADLCLHQGFIVQFNAFVNVMKDVFPSATLFGHDSDDESDFVTVDLPQNCQQLWREKLKTWFEQINEEGELVNHAMIYAIFKRVYDIKIDRKSVSQNLVEHANSFAASSVSFFYTSASFFRPAFATGLTSTEAMCSSSNFSIREYAEREFEMRFANALPALRLAMKKLLVARGAKSEAAFDHFILEITEQFLRENLLARAIAQENLAVFRNMTLYLNKEMPTVDERKEIAGFLRAEIAKEAIATVSSAVSVSDVSGLSVSH